MPIAQKIVEENPVSHGDVVVSTSKASFQKLAGRGGLTYPGIDFYNDLLEDKFNFSEPSGTGE